MRQLSSELKGVRLQPPLRLQVCPNTAPTLAGVVPGACWVEEWTDVHKEVSGLPISFLDGGSQVSPLREMATAYPQDSLILTSRYGIFPMWVSLSTPGSLILIQRIYL
jgi:hypothetical protein